MSEARIKFTDKRREIDFDLDVTYAWLDEGGIEIERIDVLDITVWFGSSGGVIDEGDNGAGIRRYIESRYREEIEQGILGQREAVRVNAEEGE